MKTQLKALQEDRRGLARAALRALPHLLADAEEKATDARRRGDVAGEEEWVAQRAQYEELGVLARRVLAKLG